MGKITLIVLISLVGFGAYWFYWEEEGANAPIVSNYDIMMTVLEKKGNAITKYDMDGYLNVYAIKDQAKFETKINIKKQNKKITEIKFDAIFRLDKQKLFLILPDSKVYFEKEFTLVPTSQAEKPGKSDFVWRDNFELAVDGLWFGNDKEKYYAIKQVPKGKEWDEWLKQAPGTKIELWFTSDTKLGSNYINLINKMLRMDMNWEKEMGGLKAGVALPKISGSGSKDKRTQLAKSDLPYFPIPLKIYFETIETDPTNPANKNHIKITATSKEFSRKKIQKSEFNVPTDYKKVNFEQFMQELMMKLMALAMSQMIR